MNRCGAVAEIASIKAESGDIYGALSIADLCDDDTGYNKSKALIAIANAMHKAGKNQEARDILLRARKNANKD